MQMGQIAATSGSDGANLFTPANIARSFCHDGLEMRVIGLHMFARTILFVGMQDDYDLAPTGPAFRRPDDPTVSDRKDWVAEVAVFTANSIEIITEVSVFGKRLSIVSECAPFAADRKVETARSRK